MPKSTFNGYEVTYTVSGVTVAADGTVGSYRDHDDLNVCLNGVKKKEHWTLTFAVTPKKGATATSLRVNGYGYPGIDKHTGHVEGKGWKYNIEEGNGSVDRLVIFDTAATLSGQTINDATKKITVSVAVTCKAKVLLNTH
jgi:hypothetical protein